MILIKPTDPVEVIYKDDQPLMPISRAEADEEIRRGHAVQVDGQKIKLFLTKEDREALHLFALWRENYICSCGSKATKAVRIKPRRKGGSDYADNLRAACEACYLQSGDKKDDEVRYHVDPLAARKMLRGPKASRWKVEGDVIDDYKNLYGPNLSRGAVRRKINNLLNNNAKLLDVWRGRRIYKAGGHLVIVVDNFSVSKIMTLGMWRMLEYRGGEV